MSQPTIVFIHGAFMTPRCWDPFVSYFTQKGYRCLAPAWPSHDMPAEQMRRSPPSGLVGLGVGEIRDHYARFIETLPEPPIIIGHSFGGLITQLLLDRNLGRAGVAIDPAPTRGVFGAAYPTAVRSTASIITKPWQKIGSLSQPEFNYAFVHTLPPAEQERVYQEQVVPETSRIFFQAALAMLDKKSPTRVNFNNGKRGPLLMIAGEVDRVVPAAMVRNNYRLYNQRSGAVTEFKEFPNRVHWIIAEPGWEEVVDYTDEWLRRQLSF